MVRTRVRAPGVLIPSGGYYIFSFIIHTICRCAHDCTTATLTAARAVISCVPCCPYAVALMLCTHPSLTCVLVSLVRVASQLQEPQGRLKRSKIRSGP